VLIEPCRPVRFGSPSTLDISIVRLYDTSSGGIVATIGMPYGVPAFVLDCLGASADDIEVLQTFLMESDMACDIAAFEQLRSQGTITT